MGRGKPKLLIIGHGRHGKDTVAEMITERMGLRFMSSSEFVGRECVWDAWGKERYETFDAMFEDRHNFRTTWKNLILAYNTPDLTRTASTMLSRGFDMYVGMRDHDELLECVRANVFDHILWVDRLDHEPKEPANSMHLTQEDADLIIDNNGNLQALDNHIKNLQLVLHNEGFDVMFPQEKEPSELEKGIEFMKNYEPEAPDLENRLNWTDMPEGATRVLDHGFIQVKEVMGTDTEIAESARMSYGRGTKKVNNDQGLINYLVRNHHTSPLEMGEIRFHMRLPIFVMRQLVRHRTANLNEYSGRYSEMVRLFYCPELPKIMYQSTNGNNQMSGASLPESEAKDAQRVIMTSANESFDNYQYLLDNNVSRETARIVLPLNTYTECVWKLDVSNLIKFLYLRDDDHAQWEIRVYAIEIAKAVETHFPAVYAAYMRERESVKFTPLQVKALVRGCIIDGMSKSECAQLNEIWSQNPK